MFASGASSHTIITTTPLSSYIILLLSLLGLLMLGLLITLIQGYRKSKKGPVAVTLWHTLRFHSKAVAIHLVVTMYLAFALGFFNHWLLLTYPPFSLVTIYVLEKLRFPLRHRKGV